jgi:hypothetical protein
MPIDRCTDEQVGINTDRQMGRQADGQVGRLTGAQMEGRQMDN